MTTAIITSTTTVTSTTTIPPSPSAVRPATPHDVGDMTATLAAAFQDDPVFGWCVPDPVRRATMLTGFFELAATIVQPYGESDIVDAAGAAALWVPAGHPAVPESAAAGFEAALEDLVGADAERTFAIVALLDEHHPTDEHRFLWFIGVRPDRQGTGSGSALLASKLARCDDERASAYLDATSLDSRRLYERHGFEVVAERSVADSPPLWAMWREPR